MAWGRGSWAGNAWADADPSCPCCNNNPCCPSYPTKLFATITKISCTNCTCINALDGQVVTCNFQASAGQWCGTIVAGGKTYVCVITCLGDPTIAHQIAFFYDDPGTLCANFPQGSGCNTFIDDPGNGCTRPMSGSRKLIGLCPSLDDAGLGCACDCNEEFQVSYSE